MLELYVNRYFRKLILRVQSDDMKYNKVSETNFAIQSLYEQLIELKYHINLILWHIKNN